MSQDNHPQPGMLLDFNLGRLADEDALAVGAHLEVCSDCCRALRDLPERDTFVALLRCSRESSSLDLPTSGHRLGDFHLIREIGRGGMGIVYEAEQRSLKRRVALKVLPGRVLTRDAQERFRRESRLAARLHHTNIVPVFEVGQEGDVCFYAMQLIAGRSLDRLTLPSSPPDTNLTASRDPPTPCCHTKAAATGASETRNAGPGQRLPPREVARIGLQVAQALAHAHERGVLHRDVKPSNLLLDDSGTVWVTDFGLAKAEDDGLTGTSDLLGTLSYMAPERFRGACDGRADVYGLGCTLYELLTQRRAFDAADPAAAVERIQRGEPVRPRSLVSDLPADLEAVVLKAMDRDATHRYPSAEEMAEDLRRFLEGQPTHARPSGPVERLHKWARRHPGIAALLATVAATLLVGIAVSVYFARKAGGEAQAARIAEGHAVTSENAARRQSAALLFDRGLPLVQQGKTAEGLHWMLAALEASPDADFQAFVRTHLRSWAGRAPVLRQWLDTRHDQAALSPDGTRAATTGVLGTGSAVQFWDLRSAEPDGEPLPTGDAGSFGPSFSPDGSRLVTLSSPGRQGQPGEATLWDVAGRRALAALQGHRGPTRGAAWSPDGRRVLTFADDGTTRAWTAADGKALGVPLSHPATPAAVTFSPDGEIAVIVSSSGVQAWEIASGRRLSELLTAPRVCTTAALSPNGQRLLITYSLGEKKHIGAYRWKPRPPGPIDKPLNLTYPTDRLAFLADSRVVPHDPAMVSRDGRRFVSVGEGVQVWETPRELSRPDNDLLAMSGRGSVEPLFHVCQFSADRRTVWTSGRGILAQQWDTETGQPVGVPVADRFATIRGRMAVSPDGKRLATVPPSLQWQRPPVRVWEAVTGQPVGPPLPQEGAVRVMAFSPDGRLLATSGHDPTVDLWEVTTGRHVVPVLAHDQAILDLAFSPDGKTLAAGTVGREVRLWDTETGQLRRLLPHPDGVRRVVYSPDGSRLLALCSGVARLWDARTGEPFGEPMASTPVRDAKDDRLKALFSDDGKALLLCGGDGSFRFWNTATTEALGPPIPSGGSPPLCFAFSPDGRLAISGHDKSVRVWDVASARPLGAPFMQAADVIGVAFALDGRAFFTVGADGTVRRWPVLQPAEGDTGRLTRALRLATGLRLDAGQSVTPLSRSEWDEERRRWRETEGDADWGVGASPSEADWHDARARDAEQLGATFTAHWHLERLAALRPGDWLTFARRGAAFTEEQRWDLAETEYRRARELGAGEGLLAWYWHRAGVCKSRLMYASALGYLDRIAEQCPEDWRVYLQRAEVYARLKDTARWEADLHKGIALRPDAPALMMLSFIRALRKDWRGAADLFSLAARSGPLPEEVAGGYALICLETGDVIAYRRICQELLLRADRAKPSPFEANAIAWTCALGPNAVADYGRALDLARVAIERAGTGAEKHERLTTLGTLLYRAGRFEAAAAQLTETLKEHGESGAPSDMLVLAMTQHRLGRTTVAREWLTRAQQQKFFKTSAWGEMEVDLLRREAEALLARQND